MSAIELVLCPVDFTEPSRRELRWAVQIASPFGAKLVLHHNLAASPLGLSRGWEWDQLHQAGYVGEDEAETRLQALCGEVPEGIAVEAVVTHGPVGAVLIEMVQRLPADLVVLGHHGLRDPDHASVTERLIEHGQCPILMLPPSTTADGFRRDDATARILVPTDLSDAAVEVMAYAAELARRVALQLHVVHVAPRGTRDAALEMMQATLRSAVPADLREAALIEVERGDPVPTILAAADRIDAAFLVMGEHARGLLSRLFRSDTAHSVLERSARPVWYVPHHCLAPRLARSASGATGQAD